MENYLADDPFLYMMDTEVQEEMKEYENTEKKMVESIKMLLHGDEIPVNPGSEPAMITKITQS